MRRIGRRKFSLDSKYDRGIVVGTAISSLLLLVGIVSGGAILNFIDIPSFLLVIGGTIGATLVHYSLEEIEQAWVAFKGVIRTKNFNPLERINYLVHLGQTVKQNGIMVLEQEAERCRDTFMRMALELTVDGQSTEDIRRILETERRTANEHAVKAVQVFETMGAYAPALGLIGTLIGLIQMLGALNSPSTVGPAMALALITTFYGAIAANLIFIPIAGKLRNRAEQDALIKAMTIEGTISLSKLEGSIMMEQRLQGYLPRMAA